MPTAVRTASGREGIISARPGARSLRAPLCSNRRQSYAFSEKLAFPAYKIYDSCRKTRGAAQ